MWLIFSHRHSNNPFFTCNKCSCAAMMTLNLSQLYWQSDHAAVALCPSRLPLSFTLWAYASVFLSPCWPAQPEEIRFKPSFSFFCNTWLEILPKTFLLNIISKHLIDQQSATFTNKYYHKEENEVSMWGFQTSYWDLLKCEVQSFQRNNIA